MRRQNFINYVGESASVFLLVVVYAFQLTPQAQSLIPSALDGFVYRNHRIDFDTVMIEAFYDPVCPDSRDSWPPLKQALEHYGSRVSLVLHLLPLPYHDNAFAASQALHIVNALNPDETFSLMEWFFKHQTKFYNDQTRNLSRVDVIDEMAKFVADGFGHSYYSVVKSGFKDRKFDLKTRVSFKYSASRGVYGTPFFYVNGFLLPDGDSIIDYKGWRSFLDPLFKTSGHRL